MDNNDILIRLRNALDIKNADLVDIFKFGDIDLTEEDVQKMLVEVEDEEVTDEIRICENAELESFLNGLIIFKRGRQEPKPGQPEKPALVINNSKSVNNVILKKLKIAFSLSSEDMLDILEEGGATVTKGELSCLFRKEGHKHYKKCSDKNVMAFLEGLDNMSDQLM